MIKIAFTEESKRELEYERYHHPHPFVQQKMEVLCLKSKEVSHGEISRLTGLCETTIRTYLYAYKKGGIEALKEIKFNRPQSAMSEHITTLEAHFREHPPATVKEAMAEIERLTGLKRNPERIRVFLKKMGLKCRKVGVIPAKADPVKQEEFKKNSWSLGLKKQKRASEPSFSSMPRTSF